MLHNVTDYLTNIFKYFAILRKQYYEEHDKLLRLNQHIDKLGNNIADALQMPDTSSLKSDNGELNIPLIKEMLENAISFEEPDYKNTDNLTIVFTKYLDALLDNRNIDQFRREIHTEREKLQTLLIQIENSSEMYNVYSALFKDRYAPLQDRFSTTLSTQ